MSQIEHFVCDDQVTGIHCYATNGQSHVEISSFEESLPMDYTLTVSKDSGLTWNGENNILWAGTPIYLTDTQTIDLSTPISLQLTGVVLVWSRYANGVVKNDSWYYQFIPKWHVMHHEGDGVYITMPLNNKSSDVCNKYVYINDTSITGHANNSIKGSNYANNARVLRAVIGV